MPHQEPNRALARAKLETLAWEQTPEARRGRSGSRREVLLDTTEGAGMVPLGELTDFQLRRYIGPGRLEEAGDMAKNVAGLTRKQLLALCWKSTHQDFKSTMDGGKWIMVIGSRGGSELAPLDSLSDAELRQKIGPRRLEEAGDMAKNGRGIYSGTAARADDYVIHKHGTSGRYYADRVGSGGTHTTIGSHVRGGCASVAECRQVIRDDAMVRAAMGKSGTIFEQRGDELVEIGHTARSHERNGSEENLSFDLSEYGATMNQWNAGQGDPIYAVGSYAYSGKIHPDRDTIESACSELERLKRRETSRARKRELSTLIEQTQEILSLQTPTPDYDASDFGSGARASAIGSSARTFRTRSTADHTDPESRYHESKQRDLSTWGISRNGREEADEVAARELSLYIENEYSLVGAANSQGKAIEKNLLGHLRRGNFDIKKAELAYMYLMETGAKKYAKEYADGKDWHQIFNKPTRELVAHEFATSFAAEHKGP